MDTKEKYYIYRKQSEWTVSTRNYLYRKANLLRAKNVLEIGCGAGVILEELTSRCYGKVWGLDNDIDLLAIASSRCAAYLISADGLRMPFEDNFFDITFAHYYLLWVDDIPAALAEMYRVTARGGNIILLAEPDYEGMIEFPERGITGAVKTALKKEGAKNLRAGRMLRSMLINLGMEPEIGIIGYDLNRADVEVLKLTGIDDKLLGAVKTLFLPIFYAISRK